MNFKINFSLTINQFLRLIAFSMLFSLTVTEVYCQDNPSNHISGNIESNFQLLNEDTIIGAYSPKEKVVLNSVMNVNYSSPKFRVGGRFESYLPSIAGFPLFYSGTGIGYRYAQYTGENLTVTLGNFYEQFGSGLILRSYEETSLGIDNAFDGMNMKYAPRPGIELKGVMGRQRLRFTEGVIEKSAGIVRGIDGSINLNDIIPNFSSSNFKVSVGGSFVSRFQPVNDTTPLNVNAAGARIDLRYKKFYLNAEYVVKEGDPSLQNSFVYNKGHGAVVNLGYSRKGLGILLVARSTNQLVFRSDKKIVGNQLMINYIPATTNNHTYNLAGTLYPYAANPGGEVAYQLDVLYQIPKKTKIGGKYGTNLHLNVAVATDHVRHTSEVQPGTGVSYIGRPFDMADSLYYFDFNFHVDRKINKKFKASLHYYHFIVNTQVNPVSFTAKNYIHADVGVLEVQYAIAPKHSIRIELQGLITEKDRGNWAATLIEYTISPSWFFSFQDQYNYGNSDPELRLHYLLGSFGFIHETTRFMFSYGKQRAGIVCIGGVCRLVPATNGLTFTFTQSF